MTTGAEKGITRRRWAMTAAAGAALSGLAVRSSAAAAAGLPRVTASDHAIGSPSAPVTVIEYGSLACPYCAEWQMMNWYAFKERFIDTGRVRFIFRETLTEPTEMAATGAAVARCSAPEQYFEVIHNLYRWQATARNFGPVSEWYERAIAVSGRAPETVRACVADPATLRAINVSMNGGASAGVSKTPTFFVNGRLIEDRSLESLTAAIEAAGG
jgi:protein-disulfide isomerase